jgi:ABC-type phosphate/phosphonate transport system substrate-binding protein
MSLRSCWSGPRSSGTRCASSSRGGPYPIQPVVVRTDLDSALKATLRECLRKTEADPRTRLELEAFGLERFVAVSEEDYDAARLPQPSPGR